LEQGRVYKDIKSPSTTTVFVRVSRTVETTVGIRKDGSVGSAVSELTVAVAFTTKFDTGDRQVLGRTKVDTGGSSHVVAGE
jgi:hypothetical protein